jgi:glycosyltransferase involved in cell wall biosynthesis
MRILYVHSTVEPPPTNPRVDRFRLLSSELEGDVLQPIWFRTPAEVEAMFGPGSYPVYTAGRFRYHWFLSPNRGVRERLETFRFYLRKGRELHRERPFDCIVVYSHMTTALCAGLLKLFTGAKLIVEIVTSPNLAYIGERARPGLWKRAMKFYSDICLHLSIFAADRAHLLYRQQLDAYPLLRGTPSSVFHEFVPVSIIERHKVRDSEGPYLLLVGAPWYLKGADLLVKAFLSLAAEYPEFKLKLMGHYPDRAELEGMSGGSPQIEILPPRPHVEALKVIAGAEIMVMPSRCEGLSRAILEGMAAAVPVIGSNVGGIPTLVRDGESGLLFPGGDWVALAAQLRQLLQDPALRRRLGDMGWSRAHNELNETIYVREFARMVKAAGDGRPLSGKAI